MGAIATLPRSEAGLPVRRTGHARGVGRWFFRALYTTVTALVCFVAALAIVIAVADRMSPGGQYVVFGHPVMSVLSGSMTGVFDTGDLIVDDPVTAAQARNLQVGQIITFREAPGSTVLITHRIVAVKTTGNAVSYVTKGDANNAPDTTPRPASDVIGLYRFAIPRGGYVLAALHQPRVLGLLFAAIALWLIAGPLFRIAREKDEPKRRAPKHRKINHSRILEMASFSPISAKEQVN
jgi:signal peptidase I